MFAWLSLNSTPLTPVSLNGDPVSLNSTDSTVVSSQSSKGYTVYYFRVGAITANRNTIQAFRKLVLCPSARNVTVLPTTLPMFLQLGNSYGQSVMKQRPTWFVGGIKVHTSQSCKQLNCILDYNSYFINFNRKKKRFYVVHKARVSKREVTLKQIMQITQFLSLNDK